jgi:hypothetical protein
MRTRGWFIEKNEEKILLHCPLNIKCRKYHPSGKYQSVSIWGGGGRKKKIRKGAL